MLEKLKQLDNRYAELGQRMENGEIYADPAAYTKCAREMKELANKYKVPYRGISPRFLLIFTLHK